MSLAVDFHKSPYGSPGDDAGRNRLSWRSQLILANNRSLLEGKKVLDLACNNGRMSYPSLVLGAASVTGVEARPELIEDGKKRLAQTGHASRMEFVQADVFDYLASLSPDRFDVITCLGFLYHTVRQVDFFRECARLRPSAVFVDTSIARNYLWYGRKLFGKPAGLFLMEYEDPTRTASTIDVDGMVFWPTASFLEEMFRRIGYRYRRIDFRGAPIRDWSGLRDYRRGTRTAYVAVPHGQDFA